MLEQDRATGERGRSRSSPVLFAATMLLRGVFTRLLFLHFTVCCIPSDPSEVCHEDTAAEAWFRCCPQVSGAGHFKSNCAEDNSNSTLGLEMNGRRAWRLYFDFLGLDEGLPSTKTCWSLEVPAHRAASLSVLRSSSTSGQ